MKKEARNLSIFIIVSVLLVYIATFYRQEKVSASEAIQYIRKLDSGVNQKGYQYQTYSYEIVPDDTTNKGIKVKELKYASSPKINDAEVSEVIEVEINSREQTFTVYQKQDFSTQIHLILCSEVDENVTATLKIDCKQKWLGFKTPKTENYLRVLDNVMYESISPSKFIQSQFYFIEDNYSSKYSIPCEQYTFSDVEYTYTIKDIFEFSGRKIVDDETMESSTEFIEIREININDQKRNIDRSAFQFVTMSSGISFKEMVSNFKLDYKEWNEDEKKTILDGDYYGFVVKMDVMYSLEYRTKIFSLNAYVAIECAEHIVYPSKLVLENDSLIF